MPRSIQTLLMFSLLGLAGALPAMATPETVDPPAADLRPPVGVAAEERWKQALEAEPMRLDLRWKLIRAIYYRGDYMSETRRAADAAWAEGTEQLEDGIRMLRKMDADRVAPHELDPDDLEGWAKQHDVEPSDLARFYFWGSIVAGRDAENIGVITAVRRGTANLVYAYVNVAITLEPHYGRGGPLRMISALHRTVPRVPFVTGWADREMAFAYAKQALELAPDEPGNRYTWAVTVEDLDAPNSRTRATLTEMSQMEPRPGFELEDEGLRKLAQEWLEESEPLGLTVTRSD